VEGESFGLICAFVFAHMHAVFFYGVGSGVFVCAGYDVR